MATKIPMQRGLESITPYIDGRPLQAVGQDQGAAEGAEWLRLHCNENPLGVSPKALAAVERALNQLNRYPDGQSYALRQALARHLGVDMAQVTVGNGADGLILQTCMAYLDEGNETITSQASFPVYDSYAYAMRATLVKVPLKGYHLDLEAMARAITDRTKIIFVCNPNNPTGTIVTADQVAAFMEHVPDHVLVVFDEAYYELVEAVTFPDTLRYIEAGRENVLVLRTFSKIYGLAGIRLGYAIAMPETLGPINRVKEPFAVNLLAQAAGVAALEDEAFLAQTVQANRDGRRYLYNTFERLGLEFVESHANFVLVRVGPGAAAVQQRLIEQGILVRPCGGYGLDEFLRVTVGTPAQNARFVDALAQFLGCR